MKLLDNIYVYPWTSYEANNCNAVFIDGPVPRSSTRATGTCWEM